METAQETLNAVQTSSRLLLSNPTTASVRTVVLNFTDGMETDGWPGVSVIQGLEDRHLAFTGADSKLYFLDSDKARIKQHLIESRSPTPGYCNIYTLEEEEARAKPLTDISANPDADDPPKLKEEEEEVIEQDEEKEMAHRAVLMEQMANLTFPLLVKPAGSSSSRGITSKSVVDTPEEAYIQAMETKKIWGPVYVEEYITGKSLVFLSGRKGKRERYRLVNPLHPDFLSSLRVVVCLFI